MGRTATPHRQGPEDIRAIQDLIWTEALFAVTAVDSCPDEAALQAYLQQHLPQNSQETRTRYTQTLLHWFFADGLQGLAAQVPVLSEERSAHDRVEGQGT